MNIKKSYLKNKISTRQIKSEKLLHRSIAKILDQKMEKKKTLVFGNMRFFPNFEIVFLTAFNR